METRDEIREFHTWAEAVAQEIQKLAGQPWAYRDRTHRDEPPKSYPSARIVRDDGAEFGLQLDTYRKRIRVSGVWPSDNGSLMSAQSWGAVEYGKQEPGITVGIGRDPRKVASDVVRRFLPPFLIVWKRMEEIRAERNDWRASRDAMIQRIHEALPGSHLRGAHQDHPCVHINIGDTDIYGDVKPHLGESVSIDLHGVPVEVATRFLRELAEVEAIR